MLVKKIMPRSMRGFTLTEAAIVLGIVGLILGAIWVAAAAVYSNMRVTTASNNLLQIVQSIRSMHATQNAVTGLTAADGALTIARAGGIPKNMLDDPNAPTVVIHAWDETAGAVEITSEDCDATDDCFAIAFNNLPREACADLLVRNSGNGRDSGMRGAGNAVAINTAFPMSVATAVAACDQAGNANSAVFTFKLKS